MLQFDVPTYHVRRYFIPNRSHKIPITPQFPAPQLLPQCRMLAEQFPGRNTLENLYHVAGTVLGWNKQKQVDVIRHYLQRVNLHLIAFRDTLEDLLQTLSHRTFQNQFPVLRNPNKVVLEIVDCMLGSFDRAHLAYTNKQIRLQRISAFLPPASWGVSSGGSL